MSQAALIESLRRKAAEDVATLWSDAKAAADKLRLDGASDVSRQKDRDALALATLMRDFEASAVVEARRSARAAGMAARVRLAERLWRVAASELATLRGGDGDAVFEAIAAELPERRWDVVRVNPADRERAAGHFPQATIVCDDGITGGMEVEAEEGRIRVSNSFETRLATAWADLLPGLMKDVMTEAEGHRTAA